MEFFDGLINAISNSFVYSIPLLVVAIAGLFSERSGIVNIALEGIMTFGVIISLLVMYAIRNAGWFDGNLLFIVGIIIAGLSGMIYSLLHAYASINMKANQIISGTALNIVAPAFGLFLARALLNKDKITFGFTSFMIDEVPLLSKIPVLGPIFFQDFYITLYLGIIILFGSYIVLYKTKFGLRLRSCGEHPQASASAGIDVVKMRYAGVLISGALAGIGGLILISFISKEYDPLTAARGYGFLALAVLISGQWKPFRILVFALIFGLASYLSLSGEIERALSIDGNLMQMLPYIITIIVLIFTSKNSLAPKAAGELYDAGKR